MKILLPPSETKRPGGDAARFAADSIALPSLAPQRDQVVDALIALSADPVSAQRVLKLSARQAGDVAHNAALRTSAGMPAIDRYTGVLFDALDAPGLDAAARRWLARHVWIHSAPFGPVGALDPIPMYRLAAGASLPGLPPLRRLWADAVTAAIADDAPSFLLDLRSEAYAALGPVPASVPSAYIRVVTDGPEGTRALNHFNKKAKGELVRALADDRPRAASIRGFRDWAESRGIRIRDTDDPRIWELVTAG